MRLIYYWNILLLVILCACGAEVGERDNPFDGGADMTDYERDVSGWSKGSEGEVKQGNISSSCYVYENKTWRLGNDYDCILGFGGCIAALQDSLRKSDFWYKCDTLMWRRASAIETDTAGWGAVKDGEVRAGQVNKTIYYIYEKSRNAWRVATTLEFDTYDYTNNKGWATGKDGDSKVGSVNANNCYVFEDKVWRVGNTSDCSLNLRGCTVLRQDTVGKGSDKVWHICDSKSWRNATTYEKDTFGWKNSTDGAIKKGNVTDTIYVFDKTAWRAASAVEGKLGGCVAAIADSLVKFESIYYICKSRVWVTATVLEYDTYKWPAGKDGDSKVGSVNANNCYVFEDKVWRVGNTSDCSLNLRGCTVLRQDTVGKGSDKVWHICDSKSWRNATTYEKDTFGWKNSTDGAIKKGNVTDTIYVFDKTAWRAASAVEGKLGGCVSAIADSVGKVGSVYYICKSRNWVEASAIEYDTYKWDAGKNGEVRVGQVNKSIYYIYETSKKSWRNATTLEKDTYDYKKNKDWADGADGQIQKGAVTDTIYVFDKTVWRVADNIENVLGGCVAAIVDSVGKAGSTYYICAPRKWIAATTIQYDTYRWSVSKDGRIKKGNVTDTFYVYDEDAYRVATAREVYINQGCTVYNEGTINVRSDTTDYICRTDYYHKRPQWVIYYNQMVDTRDNQTYSTFRIGKQIWIAGLNYTDASLEGLTRSSRDCRTDDGYTDDCREFACGCDVGDRSYLWTAAMNLPSDYLTSIYGGTSQVQGICPKGWHLPSKNEFEVSIDFLGGPVKAWFAINGYRYPKNDDFSSFENSGYNFDIYEYSGEGYYVLQSGNCGSGGGGIWTSSEENENSANVFWVSLFYAEIGDLFRFQGKKCGMPVNCIKDE